jgi:hypothetical protein
MSTTGGPNIERDGLVFGYNTGYGINTNNISSRFYPGMPTTNIVPISLSDPLWFNEYSSGRILQSETLFGQPAYEFKSNDGQIWVSPFAFNSYDRSTNDLTLSVYAKNIGGSAVSMNTYFGGDYSTDSLGASNTKSLPPDNTWRRYSWTRFSAAMVANYLEFRTANTSVVISCPQLEIGRIVSPLSNGTRSSTQSLIDLTKTSTIDVSNVSFDSTGQPTFDGTDDYIEVADNNSLDLTTNMTFEFVVKANSSQSNSYPRLIDKSNYLIHITQTSPFTIAFNVTISGGTLRQTAIGSAFTANNYSHIVCTYDGQFGKIYTNGSLVKTSDFSSVAGASTNSTSLKFGGNGTSDRVLNGEIPIAKVYSRALSADEIQQNYNAYKNRFNL